MTEQVVSLSRVATTLRLSRPMPVEGQGPSRMKYEAAERQGQREVEILATVLCSTEGVRKDFYIQAGLPGTFGQW